MTPNGNAHSDWAGEEHLLRVPESLFREESLAHRHGDHSRTTEPPPASGQWRRWSGSILAGISIMIGCAMIVVIVPRAVTATGMLRTAPEGPAAAEAGPVRVSVAAGLSAATLPGDLAVGSALSVTLPGPDGNSVTLKLPIESILGPYPNSTAVVQELGVSLLRILPDHGPSVIVYTEAVDVSEFGLGTDIDRPIAVSVPMPPERLYEVIYTSMAGKK